MEAQYIIRQQKQFHYFASVCCVYVLVKVIFYSYLILKKMNERITDS